MPHYASSPFGELSHLGLVEDMRVLKTDAEAAQTRLEDACRRIEQEVRTAAQSVVPDELTPIERFAVKRNAMDHVKMGIY